jgi:hypothetical protein
MKHHSGTGGGRVQTQQPHPHQHSPQNATHSKSLLKSVYKHSATPERVPDCGSL